MALTWADKRRFYIIGGAALIGLTLLAGIVIAIVYEAPACNDGKRNQDETGIDCGGSCELVCREDVESARVPFARALTNAAGRTDLVAYIENRNQGAEAKGAVYTAEIFDAQGRLLGSREGTVDLPARAIVPVFIPGIGVGSAARAFLSIAENTKWRVPRNAEEVLSVGAVAIQTGAQPRVTAPIENLSAKDEFDRTVIATVFNGEGEAIAASQTVLRAVSAFGKTDAVFTWNEPFPQGALRAEVRVVPRLP